MKVATTLIVILLTINHTFGQTPKITFNSRVIFDSSISGYDKSQQNAQMLYSLEDFRVGFVAAIKDITVKADVGFYGGAAKIKDLYLNYNMKNSHISIGNSYKPFSMDMLTSTLDMSFNQVASATLAFGDSRRIGISYNLDLPNIYFATGIYSDNDINSTKESRSNALLSASRIILRLKDNYNNIYHVGGSYSFTSSNRDENGLLKTTSISSIGVTNMFGESVATAQLDYAGAKSTGGVEVLTILSRWRFQGEYFLNRIVFNNSQEVYHPNGGYIQTGVLLVGRGYSYNTRFAMASRPKSKRAVELTARYSYINLTDYSAGILGGLHNDISLGVNYYINTHFAVKLNGSYLHVDDNCTSFYSANQMLAQLRLQFAI